MPKKSGREPSDDDDDEGTTLDERAQYKQMQKYKRKYERSLKATSSKVPQGSLFLVDHNIIFFPVLLTACTLCREDPRKNGRTCCCSRC